MLKLFLAEFERRWIEFIRYPVEAIGIVTLTTLVFYGLFLSARYIAGPALHFGDRLDVIVVGYVLWTLVLSIFNDLSIGLQIEAQTGTLEQVFLSPFGAPRVFLARAVASLALRIVLMTSILLLIVTITGVRLHFPVSILFPLITVLLGAYGLALIAGGLALLFKRVQQLLGFLQFALLFLLSVPTATWIGSLRGLRLLLPMSLGADELRAQMALNQGLDFPQLLLALLNGLGYFALGLLVFSWAEREAKRRGILGGY